MPPNLQKNEVYFIQTRSQGSSNTAWHCYCINIIVDDVKTADERQFNRVGLVHKNQPKAIFHRLKKICGNTPPILFKTLIPAFDTLTPQIKG